MVPKAALPSAPFGFEKFTALVTLYASTRTCSRALRPHEVFEQREIQTPLRGSVQEVARHDGFADGVDRLRGKRRGIEPARVGWIVELSVSDEEDRRSVRPIPW